MRKRILLSAGGMPALGLLLMGPCRKWLLLELTALDLDAHIYAFMHMIHDCACCHAFPGHST